ncbi:MAG: hypothetical protein RLZZ518_1121, partial [Actinomycetota bacterium]
SGNYQHRERRLLRLGDFGDVILERLESLLEIFAGDVLAVAHLAPRFSSNTETRDQATTEMAMPTAKVMTYGTNDKPSA